MLSPFIFESKHFSKIFELVSYNSLVALDLDNTVMQAQSSLGCDYWAYQFLSKLILESENNQFTKQQYINIATNIYNDIQQYVKVQAVEQNTAKYIQTIQNTHIPVIGVTARNYDLNAATIRQLESINVQFTPTQPFPQYTRVTNETFDASAKFSNGILYCGEQDKGKSLKELLTSISYAPEHIVMFDDKKNHIVEMSQTLNQTKFTGVHYTQVNDSHTFDQHEANQQLKFIFPRLEEQTKENIHQLGLLDHAPTSPSIAHHFNRFFYDSKPEQPTIPEETNSKSLNKIIL